jgi:ligand-binding SRPBCC domain-containing protein
MRVLSERVKIEAPMAGVWEVLADFGGVADWAPYMKTCQLVGGKSAGVGMRREMRHAWGFRFEERVTDWTEGRGFSFDVLRAPFPMKHVKESWVITGGNGVTTVATQVSYEMHLSVVGQALDTILVSSIVRREMRVGLAGLKQFIEAR